MSSSGYFYLKRGATAPSLRRQLMTETGPIDLSGATVTVAMGRRRGSAPVFTGRPAVVEDAEAGVVVYHWQEGDTDATGNHRLEFTVTYDDGGVEIVPSYGAVEIVIGARIGDEG